MVGEKNGEKLESGGSQSTYRRDVQKDEKKEKKKSLPSTVLFFSLSSSYSSRSLSRARTVAHACLRAASTGVWAGRR